MTLESRNHVASWDFATEPDVSEDTGAGRDVSVIIHKGYSALRTKP